MQIQQAIKWYKTELLSVYAEDECRAITELVFMHVFNFSKAKLLSAFNLEIDATIEFALKNYLSRQLKSEPVQYVLGETEFYGLPFLVNSSVLIPRPETEELVQYLLNNIGNNKILKVLDIGTGSGCIPVSIKKNNPQLNVYALDVSADALAVAKQNAVLNNVDVNFIEADILNFNSAALPQSIDIIVSNPPYVCKSEMQLMQPNVLTYEPHLALFVNDDDALLFYKAIARFALQHLSPSGKLYFEINEAKGDEVVKMLQNNGFQNVILKKDLYGKDRIIGCEKLAVI